MFGVSGFRHMASLTSAPRFGMMLPVRIIHEGFMPAEGDYFSVRQKMDGNQMTERDGLVLNVYEGEGEHKKNVSPLLEIKQPENPMEELALEAIGVQASVNGSSDLYLYKPEGEANEGKVFLFWDDHDRRLPEVIDDIEARKSGNGIEAFNPHPLTPKTYHHYRLGIYPGPRQVLEPYTTEAGVHGMKISQETEVLQKGQSFWGEPINPFILKP